MSKHALITLRHLRSGYVLPVTTNHRGETFDWPVCGATEQALGMIRDRDLTGRDNPAPVDHLNCRGETMTPGEIEAMRRRHLREFAIDVARAPWLRIDGHPDAIRALDAMMAAS